MRAKPRFYEVGEIIIDDCHFKAEPVIGMIIAVCYDSPYPYKIEFTNDKTDWYTRGEVHDMMQALYDYTGD